MLSKCQLLLRHSVFPSLRGGGRGSILIELMCLASGPCSLSWILSNVCTGRVPWSWSDRCPARSCCSQAAVPCRTPRPPPPRLDPRVPPGLPTAAALHFPAVFAGRKLPELASGGHSPRARLRWIVSWDMLCRRFM